MITEMTWQDIVSKETLFDYIAEHECICSNQDDVLSWCVELEKKELLIQCDKITHNRQMLNPGYTYVMNDARGREVAVSYPLATLILN